MPFFSSLYTSNASYSTDQLSIYVEGVPLSFLTHQLKFDLDTLLSTEEIEKETSQPLNYTHIQLLVLMAIQLNGMANSNTC